MYNSIQNYDTQQYGINRGIFNKFSLKNFSKKNRVKENVVVPVKKELQPVNKENNSKKKSKISIIAGASILTAGCGALFLVGGVQKNTGKY